MGRTKKDNTFKQTIMAQQYRIYTGVEAQDKFLDEDALISQQADMTIAINIFPHLLMSKKATVLLNPLYVMLHEGDNQDKVHD